jgi:outer membrane protein OmpA-like peptidoglycan-associated protein
MVSKLQALGSQLIMKSPHRPSRSHPFSVAAWTGFAVAVALGAAPAAHAQLQDVGGGVSVDMSVLNSGYGAYSAPAATQAPYATAAPGASPQGLLMPGGAMPGSTFYGLGPTPNNQRLPKARPYVAQPASAPAAASDPEPMTAEAPAPEPEAAPQPAPEPAPAEAVAEPEPLAEPSQTASADVPPPPPPAPEPTATADVPPPPPAPATAPAEAPEPATASEPVETAAVAPEAPAPPPDTGLTRLTFAPGDSKPTQAASETLAAIGQQLLANDGLRLEIRAFAGGDGMSDNRARRLSLARALAVRSDLIEQGVRSNRIDVRALGNKTDEEPLDRVDLAVSGN